MTDEERAEFRLYMRLMEAWGRFVVPLRPPGFSDLIDIKDAVAVIQGNACCVWQHNPECPRSDLEKMTDHVPEDAEAIAEGRACCIWNHRAECYVTKYPHLATHILGPR